MTSRRPGGAPDRTVALPGWVWLLLIPHFADRYVAKREISRPTAWLGWLLGGDIKVVSDKLTHATIHAHQLINLVPRTCSNEPAR